MSGDSTGRRSGDEVRRGSAHDVVVAKGGREVRGTETQTNTLAAQNAALLLEKRRMQEESSCSGCRRWPSEARRKRQPQCSETERSGLEGACEEEVEVEGASGTQEME